MVRAFMAEVEASGITDYTAHGLSRPPITEALATAEVFELGAGAGCPVHIVHSSIGRGYELAAAYRAQGHGATIEACVHYLTLDEENDVRRLGGKAKINPPLRPRHEVEALWHHLAAGNVTIVSTDHVSWSEDRKTDPNMLKNASGIPGLEALYALLLKGLDERRLPLTHAARLLAHNPAALFRIGHVKGALAVGRDADIVLMRRDPYRYNAAASGNNFVSWSPYDGIDLAVPRRRDLSARQLRCCRRPRRRRTGTGPLRQPRARRVDRSNPMTQTNLPLDADRLWADVMALAEITDPQRPYTRRSFTALFLEGRAWLAAEICRSRTGHPDRRRR